MDVTPEELELIQSIDPNATGPKQYLKFDPLDLEMDLPAETIRVQNRGTEYVRIGRVCVSLLNGWCWIDQRGNWEDEL